MTYFHLHILIIALLTAVACCIPGLFLVLRGVALMSDAISHAILPGIVIMFLFVHDLESPLLIIGAACAGIITVLLTQAIIQTQRLKKDAAIGLVFPLFFSIGIILISKLASSVHLDLDMVLLGELAFTPFDRWYINGIDCGPSALWSIGCICIMNMALLKLFYKELKITTFDPALASILGFSASAFFYGIMFITSITAVGAFNIVGSIVVVALMITPASCAYLLCSTLSSMIYTSIALACLSTLGGCIMAHAADVSIAGSIACASGIIFMFVFLFAPEKGFLSKMVYKRQQHNALARRLMLEHLQLRCCSTVADIAQHLGWSFSYAKKIMFSVRGELVEPYERS